MGQDSKLSEPCIHRRGVLSRAGTAQNIQMQLAAINYTTQILDSLISVI